MYYVLLVSPNPNLRFILRPLSASHFRIDGYFETSAHNDWKKYKVKGTQYICVTSVHEYQVLVTCYLWPTVFAFNCNFDTNAPDDHTWTQIHPMKNRTLYVKAIDIKLQERFEKIRVRFVVVFWNCSHRVPWYFGHDVTYTATVSFNNNVVFSFLTRTHVCLEDSRWRQCLIFSDNLA